MQELELVAPVAVQEDIENLQVRLQVVIQFHQEVWLQPQLYQLQ